MSSEHGLELPLPGSADDEGLVQTGTEATREPLRLRGGDAAFGDLFPHWKNVGDGLTDNPWGYGYGNDGSPRHAEADAPTSPLAGEHGPARLPSEAGADPVLTQPASLDSGLSGLLPGTAVGETYGAGRAQGADVVNQIRALFQRAKTPAEVNEATTVARQTLMRTILKQAAHAGKAVAVGAAAAGVLSAAYDVATGVIADIKAHDGEATQTRRAIGGAAAAFGLGWQFAAVGTAVGGPVTGFFAGIVGSIIGYTGGSDSFGAPLHRLPQATQTRELGLLDNYRAADGSFDSAADKSAWGSLQPDPTGQAQLNRAIAALAILAHGGTSEELGAAKDFVRNNEALLDALGVAGGTGTPGYTARGLPDNLTPDTARALLTTLVDDRTRAVHGFEAATQAIIGSTPLDQLSDAQQANFAQAHDLALLLANEPLARAGLVSSKAGRTVGSTFDAPDLRGLASWDLNPDLSPALSAAARQYSQPDAMRRIDTAAHPEAAADGASSRDDLEAVLAALARPANNTATSSTSTSSTSTSSSTSSGTSSAVDVNSQSSLSAALHAMPSSASQDVSRLPTDQGASAASTNTTNSSSTSTDQDVLDAYHAGEAAGNWGELTTDAATQHDLNRPIAALEILRDPSATAAQQKAAQHYVDANPALRNALDVARSANNPATAGGTPDGKYGQDDEGALLQALRDSRAQAIKDYNQVDAGQKDAARPLALLRAFLPVVASGSTTHTFDAKTNKTPSGISFTSFHSDDLDGITGNNPDLPAVLKDAAGAKKDTLFPAGKHVLSVSDSDLDSSVKKPR